MHKKLKNLIRNTKEIFSQEFLDKIARKTGFIKRNGKIDVSTFLAFNIFLSHDMCDKSLATLCRKLAANYGVLLFRKLSMSGLIKKLLNLCRNFLLKCYLIKMRY